MKKGLGQMVRNQGTVRRLQGMKVCPAIGEHPGTVMLQELQEICERCQQQGRIGKAYKMSLCDLCQGKMLPKELMIESLNRLEQKRKRPRHARTFPGRNNGALRIMPQAHSTC